MKLTISQEENKALYKDLKNANKNLVINRIISAQKQNDISEFENNTLEDLKIHEE